MADQNLEYSLKIMTDSAEAAMNKFFKDLGKQGDAFAKKLGKDISDGLKAKSGGFKGLEDEQKKQDAEERRLRKERLNEEQQATQKRLDDKRAENAELKRLEKQAQEADNNAAKIRAGETLAQARIESARKYYTLDWQYQDAVSRAAEDYHSKLRVLSQQAVSMKASEIQAKLQLEAASFSRSVNQAKELAQIQRNMGFAGITRMNKTVQALYNVQQTVEDFSYAGVRGATNNLGFMASMLGGRAGVAAMFSVLALNVLHATGALEALDKKLGISETLMSTLGMKTQKEIEAIETLTERWLKFESYIGKGRQDKATFDLFGDDKGAMRKQIADAESELAVITDRNRKLREAVNLYGEMERAAKKFSEEASVKGLFGGSMTPEEVSKGMADFEEHIRLLRSNEDKSPDSRGAVSGRKQQAALDEFKALERQFRSMAPAAALSEEGIAKIRKEIAGLDDEAQKVATSLQTFQDIAKQIEGLDPFNATARNLSSTESLDSLLNTDNMESFASQKLTEQLSQQKKLFEERAKKINEAASLAAQEIQTQLALTNDLDKRVALEEAIKDIRNDANVALQWAKSDSEEMLKLAQQHAQAASDTYQALEKASSELENQLKLSQSIVDKEQERISAIREEEAARRAAEARRKADALDRIDDLKASEAIEKNQEGLKSWKERADVIKENAKRWADARREFLKSTNMPGKGALNPDNQIDQEYDRFMKMLDDKYAAELQHEEKRVELANQTAERAAEKSKMARLNALKDELGGTAQDEVAAANQKAGAGDFEGALKAVDKAEAALKNLQQAQEKMVGKVTSEQAIKAEKEMDATGAKMAELSALKEDLIHRQAEAEKLKAQDLQKELDKTTATMQALQAMSPAQLISPETPGVIQQANQQLQQTLQLLQSIKAVQGMGGAGGLMAGGPDGRGMFVQNNTFNTSMGAASPSVAMAAQVAAVQNLAIQRA